MIFIDCEGDPIQEFSAIYVNNDEIIDVFHRYVHYPSFKDYDGDRFARFHVHGLNIDFLSQHGLENTDILRSEFFSWLNSCSYSRLFAHAPMKEMNFLNLPIEDVCLRLWKDRHTLSSHRKAIFMKKNCIPICNIVCKAHTSFRSWRCKKRMNFTDMAKRDFGHHCSLYDCVECFLFSIEGK